MNEHMGHASLLTNTCSTVLGHRRVYMAYIYINSLFNMFFFNSTFTKIIRKIFRLKVKKKTDLSLPSFGLQLKQGYQYMYIYICLPGIKYVH